MKLRVLLCAAVMVFVALSGLARAAAQERGGFGLTKARGNPLAALQAQIDALAARVAEFERGGATPRTLNGDYAFTLVRTCANTAPGSISPPPDFVFLSPSTVNEAVFRGILSYRTDGTGTLTAELLRIDSTPPGISPVQQAALNSSLTYSVNPDGSFTQEFARVDFTI